MGRDCDRGRVSNDLVADAPFSVWIAVREVQRAGHDADGWVLLGQVAAEILEMRPVVAVEAFAHLRTHVGQGEGGIHGILRPFGVCGGHLVAAVVTGAEVVGQLGAEDGWNGGILDEDAVFAICVLHGEGVGGDVFGHPGRIAGATVVGTRQGQRVQRIVHGSGKAILKEACRINRSSRRDFLCERRCCRRRGELASSWRSSHGRLGCLLLLLLELLLLRRGPEGIEESSSTSTGGCTSRGDDCKGSLRHGGCCCLLVTAIWKTRRPTERSGREMRGENGGQFNIFNILNKTAPSPAGLSSVLRLPCAATEDSRSSSTSSGVAVA